MSDYRITAHTYMGDFGQMLECVRIEGPGLPEESELSLSDFVCERCNTDCGDRIPGKGVVAVKKEGDSLTLEMDPCLFRGTFCITFDAKGQKIVIDKSTIDKIELYHEDLFRAVEEDGLIYRIYEPKALGPRPLLLFLHGGGGCGTDNMLPLIDTLGAIHFAERCPDMYVMAPQAPEGDFPMEVMMKRLAKGGDHFKVILRNPVENGPEARGWTRPYLGLVTDKIREMIADGKVDPARVYVTGLSAGGFGTLKAVAVAPDLFAGALPVCPSMNGESYPILENFPEVPAWIATSYIDHQVARHAYIMRAVQKLWDRGRKNIRFTIFTPEELAEYGIGTEPDLPAKELYAQNHNSWVLVYHNEYCMLDWLFSQRKKS